MPEKNKTPTINLSFDNNRSHGIPRSADIGSFIPTQKNINDNKSICPENTKTTVHVNTVVKPSNVEMVNASDLVAKPEDFITNAPIIEMSSKIKSTSAIENKSTPTIENKSTSLVNNQPTSSSKNKSAINNQKTGDSSLTKTTNKSKSKYAAETTKLGKFRNVRGNSRRKVQWTEIEVEMLMKGVQKFGTSNWGQVLYYGKDVFDENRRTVDLVHKYRQHIKKSSYYLTPVKLWVQVDQEGMTIKDSLGEISVIREKFPYDAARKIAKSIIKSKKSADSINTIFLSELDDNDYNPNYKPPKTRVLHAYNIISLCWPAVKIQKVVYR